MRQRWPTSAHFKANSTTRKTDATSIENHSPNTIHCTDNHTFLQALQTQPFVNFKMCWRTQMVMHLREKLYSTCDNSSRCTVQLRLINYLNKLYPPGILMPHVWRYT